MVAGSWLSCSFARTLIRGPIEKMASPVRNPPFSALPPPTTYIARSTFKFPPPTTPPTTSRSVANITALFHRYTPTSSDTHSYIPYLPPPPPPPPPTKPLQRQTCRGTFLPPQHYQRLVVVFPRRIACT
ncbi:hypothetical protein L211DRAFT_347130 [Terfezia boudieri ATCC MYA-4762]|uniref:Uncharacterized protein n=1 Tax=Terfezia boudieri ATCC MYA-4762 TaxID=1051890 RepID=A0A3N4LLF0_9PEZI|nr:hypothetical protein L211DRAFT_347130 [Terfezia boudieri ATCC MYA-4762]